MKERSPKQALSKSTPVPVPGPEGIQLLKSTSKTTLVIPDIHNNFAQAEAWIRYFDTRFPERVSQVVFLGDYFDDFGDTPEIALGVAEWLKHSIQQPNRVHLIGNHDLAYLAPAAFTRCSGFETRKLEVITPILDEMPRTAFRAALEVDGWLLSHAGFHPTHVAGHCAAELVELADSALRQLWTGDQPALFAAGYARGGSAPVGGITWLDWSKEFRPTIGLHQIVGHTPADTFRIAWVDDPAGGVTRRTYDLNVASGEVFGRGELLSLNLCVDTRFKSVALLENATAVLW